MKLSLFTEVQCPSGASPLHRLTEALDQAELADKLGFHAFWLSEIHFQQEFSVLSAPYPVLGALSQRTRRIRLGVAVNILPVHHPIHVAESVAMLDLLSQGRVDVAVGRGHVHTRVYEGFGANRATSRLAIEEGLKLMVAAWTQTPMTFAGDLYRVPEIVVNPKPIQKPHPPLYTAVTSPDGVEFAAHLGLNVLLATHLFPRDRIKAQAAAYWDGLRVHGHDASQRELGVLVPLHLAQTTERARERAGEGIMDYYRVVSRTGADYRRWLAEQGLEAAEPMAGRSPADGLTFERICAENGIIGDAATAVAELRRLADETGATQFLCWMNMGSVPHHLVMESMERFAREVMPQLVTGTPMS